VLIPLPETFYTIKDGQTKMTIDVYEGERSMVKNNHLLGLFDMVGLPPMPRGDIAVRITYKIDANGMLQVVAENVATKETKEITINPESGRLSQEDVDRMVQEAEEYAEQDKLVKERIESRSQLESLLYDLNGKLNDLSKEFTVEARKELTDMIDENMEWLEDNHDAEQDEFESRHAMLGNLSSSIVKAMKHDEAEAEGDDESNAEL
jgi:heat shock protein 5